MKQLLPAVCCEHEWESRRRQDVSVVWSYVGVAKGISDPYRTLQATSSCLWDLLRSIVPSSLSGPLVSKQGGNEKVNIRLFKGTRLLAYWAPPDALTPTLVYLLTPKMVEQCIFPAMSFLGSFLRILNILRTVKDQNFK